MTLDRSPKQRSAPDAPDTENETYARGKVGLSGYLVIVAMIAAVCQTMAIALAPQISGLTLMDDTVVVLLVLSVLTRLRPAPGWTVFLLCCWVAMMIVGALNSAVSVAPTFVLFRQATIPALLVLCGLTLTSREWRVVVRFTIIVGIFNALYMVLELSGIRVLDPATLATYDRDHLRMRDGLPTYYHYYDDIFGRLTRLGGTVLNPPIAGLVTGAALAFLWYDKSFRYRTSSLILLAVTTVLTFGRGGILVAGIAIVLPILFARLGSAATVGAGAAAACVIGLKFAADGNSAIHARGLLDGVVFGLSSPIGSGFGVIGNHLKALHITESSESLLGIVFAAGGFVTLVIIAALLLQLLFAIRRAHSWEAAVGVGILAAALFSESAGALNGTIPLWLAIGVALKKWHEYRQQQTAERRSRVADPDSHFHERLRRPAHAQNES